MGRTLLEKNRLDGGLVGLKVERLSAAEPSAAKPSQDDKPQWKAQHVSPPR
jgi:hypothetical protein